MIIQLKDDLLVADSFTKKEYALYENTFTDVVIGDFTFNKTFMQSEVLYFKLSEAPIQQILQGINDSYSKLIGNSIDGYNKSKGFKGVFKYDTLPMPNTPEYEAFTDLLSNKFKNFMNSEKAIVPLGKGQDLIISDKGGTNQTTRDIKELINDISDFTAKAFGIHPALLRGDVQGVADAMDNFLTFCIDPLVEMFAEEINRKMYGAKAMQDGSYLKIDTRAIKHVDILTVANSIDKLIGSGMYSINELREVVGDDKINEDWADNHVITKNYSNVDEFVKGGETTKSE